MSEDKSFFIKINHNSKLPLHVQVEELLRGLIALPEYKNGAFLPKEVELANRLGISRNTIRQATNKLENEGLLTRKKGVGTKVAQPALSTGLNKWQSFTKEMHNRGVKVVNLSLKLEKVAASEKMANFFNIKANTTVFKLSKLKGVETEPIVYFESFFHPRIDFTDRDDLNRPLYELLEEKYGILVERSSEHISAQAAERMARILQVDRLAPVLFRERYVYDHGGRPVEYNLGYYRADKFTYSIEIKKED